METLRVSSYMIPVKLKKGNGKYILIHGYTGTIDMVSEDLALKLIHNDLIENVNISSTTFQLLRNRGYITALTKDQEIEYVARIAQVLHKKARLLYKSFTMIVTYNCNFRCPYCFEDRKMKDSISDLSFTKEMIDKAYTAMDQIEPNEQMRNKTITLYGGEPLLAQNKNIVEYLVKKGHEKKYKFMALTNGYELNYFIDLLSPEFIGLVQITIDGTKDNHNKRRLHYKDDETFDKIVLNIKHALKKGIEVIVRVNCDNKNVEDFARLKKHFKDHGFFSYSSFKMYPALLWDSDSISDEEIKSLDFISSEQYISKHKKMETLKHCKDFGISHSIHQALTTGEPIAFKNIFCSSQAGGYIFDPLGNIYPCFEIVGNKQHRIGHYRHNDIEWDNEKLNIWHNYNITVNSQCKECKYALFCGGGCVAHKMSGKKDHCFYFQTIFHHITNYSFENISK